MIGAPSAAARCPTIYKLSATPLMSERCKFLAVDEAIIGAAFVSDLKFPSSLTAVSLRSLNSDQLCQLFDHCYLYNLGDFILRNELIGIHLEDGVDEIQDLLDLGLNKITAKALFKRITAWKTEGLPADFHPTSSVLSNEPTCSAATTAASSSIANIAATTLSTSTPPSVILSSSAVSPEKELDKDFVAACYCGDHVAKDRIVGAADVGNHLAEAYLSILYNRKGWIVELDRKNADYYATKALSWLRDKAAKGNIFAMFIMATFYADGRRDVNIDNIEAFRLYKLAADQAHAGSLFQLGFHYLKNENKLAAFRYYKLAADRGHAGAQYSLCLCYTKSIGVTQDVQEAVKYCRLAAEQGHAEALYQLGMRYWKGEGVTHNETEAARYFQLAADQGHAEAQFYLGTCFDGGNGVSKDQKVAMRYYQLAADQGHATAQFAVGFYHSNGIVLKADETLSVKYYKLAAEQGHTGAQYNLGIYYMESTGVVQDLVEAVRYFKLAADEIGEGVAMNKTEALRYYRLAAEQGDSDAQYSLGRCYEIGVGVSMDKKEAIKYYKLATAQNNTEAQRRLDLLDKERAGGKK